MVINRDLKLRSIPRVLPSVQMVNPDSFLHERRLLLQHKTRVLAPHPLSKVAGMQEDRTYYLGLDTWRTTCFKIFVLKSLLPFSDLTGFAVINSIESCKNGESREMGTGPQALCIPLVD